MGAPFFSFFFFGQYLGFFKGGEGGVWIGLGWVGGSGSKFLGRIPRRYYNGGVGSSKKKKPNQQAKIETSYGTWLVFFFFFSESFFFFLSVSWSFLFPLPHRFPLSQRNR